ncbi:MAG: 1-deoxy-D-xylulose-5-phosphate synthase [Moheibacter sp.]
MKSILDHIETIDNLRQLPKTKLPDLALEIREFILDTLSVKPGHLGANLGVVELTIALHYFYDTPKDQLIWDVGHQCYPHKILTGRKSNFDSLRQLEGISGFPSREESSFDTFGTGHSSTSISAITGMVLANQLQKKSNQHIAVIGDASIVSGMALEGLNHLGSTDLDVLIILNDNSIGIDPSVGALKEHFFNLKREKSNSIFEKLGFYYKGVIDGHNFNELFDALEELKTISKPKLLHIKTTKGKGYPSAEADQVKWHSPGIFDKKTGEIPIKKENSVTFQQVFGETLIKLMQQNQKIVATTPAMLSGSNLIEAKKQFPNRIFDVGIAEQHAVTFSAGLATQGLIPYCTIYSTFLQRAYDQMIHDVALQNLPVVFCIDRAGIVGTDGATHHGYFDTAFLNSIPNVVVTAPMNATDFQNLLYTAQFTKIPFTIRYPKAKIDGINEALEYKKIKIGKAEELQKGSKVAILTFGTIGNRVQSVLNQINQKKQFGLYKFIFSKPLDKNKLNEIFENYSTLITFEDGVLSGGFGSLILEYAAEKNYKGKITRKGYPDKFIEHASIEELEKQIGLDKFSIQQLLTSLI